MKNSLKIGELFYIEHYIIFAFECRWAVVKDEEVYERMNNHVLLNTLGVPQESQLRALQLVKVALDQGKGLFGFGFKTLSSRWTKLNDTLSLSKRFSLQKMEAQYCSFFNTVREPSPGNIYALVIIRQNLIVFCHQN